MSNQVGGGSAAAGGRGSWWPGVLKYGLGFGALAYVLASNWSTLGRVLNQTPRWEYLLAAAGLAVACTALQLFRWYLLVRALDLPFSGRGAVRLGLVGYYYNSFLPGSVGGDVVKAFFIARGRPDRKAAAVATVAADRLIGLFGLILFISVLGGGCWAAGVESVAGNTHLKKIVTVCVGIAAAVVTGYVTVGLLPTRVGDRIGATVSRAPGAGRTLGELWATAWVYSRRRGTVLAAVGLSAVVHVMMVVAFHLTVRVFPPDDPGLLASLPEHFVIAPVGYIGQAFFPAPGGVGGAEAIFGYLYTLIKGDTEEARAVGVAGRLSLRLVEWSLALIGFAVYLRMRDDAPPPAEVVAAEPGPGA